jgi:uncharacterized protein
VVSRDTMVPQGQRVPVGVSTMTESHGPDAVPFWRRKRLDEMTSDEWDSLCDRCGRCCLSSLRADDTAQVYALDLGCVLQDPATGGCADYANRKLAVPTCIQLTPTNVGTLDVLPPTCGYVRVHRGEHLEWWHPLVSGTLESVRAAGMSAAGRFVKPRFAGAIEYHTVDWPMQPVTADPRENWKKAMFGGVNASVPTPFGPDNRVDLDLMAEHCFWLLSNGCHGLAVLDRAGEVASLSIAERIGMLEGLVRRGVPASKLLVGIGPAAPADGARIARRTHELGIRGVMASVSVPDRVLPRDVLSPGIQTLIAAMPERLHLFLSFSANAAATPACVTALKAFMAAAPERLTGLRDEAPGCDLAIAALNRFGGYPLEVYIAAAAKLGAMISRGGTGLIGSGGNLLGRQCAAIVRGARPEQVASIQDTIEAVERSVRLRSPISAIKALLARRTGRPQWGRVRLPLRAAAPSEQAALFALFDDSGVHLRPVIRSD